MNLLQRVESWGDAHHPKWLDIIRIVLGCFLVYKGIDVLQNSSDIVAVMKNRSSFGDFAFILAVHYAAFAHIVGGGLLIFGLFTRVACLIQIPVLIGAILFVGTSGDMLRPYSELFLSVLVLLLLIYFLIVGNGPWAIRIPEEKRKLETL